jgi:RNA polymerase sigma-70 factor, ECF subfamily
VAVSASQHVVADTRHEELLLAELASGDRERALAGLYAAYGRRIYRLGLVLLRDDGLAEDLVQETFVRLWRSAHRYDASRGSVRSFVLTLARRAAVDLWRRRERALPEVHDGREREDAESGKAFADAVLRLDLREALDELSPAHREVLELQYSRDLTQAQVATRLDIPLGTVKSRTLYALRALAHRLSERDLRG